MKNVYWNAFDKISGKLILFVIPLSLMWYCFPTAMVYDQISMSVTKDESGKFWINSQREVNWFDEILVDYSASIRVVGRDDAPVCSYEGQFNASKVPGDPVRYEALPWAVPCLEQGPPTAITFVRQALLFDFIPMRPQRYTFVINPDAAPVVSTEEKIQ